MRDKIRMVSSAGTGHFYTTTKNKRTMTEKLEMKKFDPVVRQHVMYKEAKIKQKIDYLVRSAEKAALWPLFCWCSNSQKINYLRVRLLNDSL